MIWRESVQRSCRIIICQYFFCTIFCIREGFKKEKKFKLGFLAEVRGKLSEGVLGTKLVFYNTYEGYECSKANYLIMGHKL